jgi:hypothetical protein
MKFSSTLSHFHDSNVYGHHIPLPEGVMNQLENVTDKRVICTIEGKVTIHSALISDGKGSHYILINKEIRNKLGLRLGQEVSVELQPDTTRYGMEMPEELEELLLQDEMADKLFHDLTPGKQRSLIHWVSTVKSPDKRLKGALVMTRHLTGHNGKLDWKQLTAEMKADNQPGYF